MDIPNIIKNAMKEDLSLAWGWHCNIAMAFYDQMNHEYRNSYVIDANKQFWHKIANVSAASFMKLCFDVETTQCKEYPYEK